MSRGGRRLCHYCRTGMTKRGTHDPRSATKDHIIPKSRGGTNSPVNIVVCCRKCNNEKGDFTATEYRAWIRAGRPRHKDFQAQLAAGEIPLRGDPFDANHAGNNAWRSYSWLAQLYCQTPSPGGKK